MTQPNFATLWSPDGLKTFMQVKPGDTIWTGKRWTKIVQKISCDVLPAFRYNSRMNAQFCGTKNHRILQYRRAVPVGQATWMDSSLDKPYVWYQSSEIYMLSESEEIHPTWMLELEGRNRVYWTGGVLALDYRGEMQGSTGWDHKS